MKQTIYVIKSDNEYLSSVTPTHIFWSGLFTEAKIFNNKQFAILYQAHNDIKGYVYSIEINPIKIN